MSNSFPSTGVLGAITGILMGDIGDVYRVFSFVLGREAFTHEIPHYHARVKASILAAHPTFPDSATGDNWQQVLSDFVAAHGENVELSLALEGFLADGKNFRQTLDERVAVLAERGDNNVH